MDKVWEDEASANLLIKCLFSAVVDMQRIQHLKIVVALRTNIFEQLQYGEQSRGSQEEKFRGLAFYLQWTENDLQSLLEQRAEAASTLYELEPPKSLAEMLPRINKEAGNPLTHILSRTLMRPRDAILYLNACIREAAGKERVTWENITRAEKRYSDGRLMALRDEWKDPYLDIDKVLNYFRSQSFRLSRPEMTRILDNIVELPADPKFRGTIWLTKLSEAIWAPGSNEMTWYEWYGPLVNLLYHISFLGLAKGSQGVATYSYQALERVIERDDLPEDVYFEIHPAFRRALDILEETVETQRQGGTSRQKVST